MSDLTILGVSSEQLRSSITNYRRLLALGLTGLVFILMLNYSLHFLHGEELLLLFGLVCSTILFCHFFYLYLLQKHIREKDDARNQLLKNQEFIEGNYKSLQLFLKSIPELNELFQAHLAVVNESTEKASLAIIDKLLSVEVEANRFSSLLEEEKKIFEEMRQEVRGKMEVCLQTINVVSEQMKRYYGQREQDFVLGNAAIIKAKELPSLVSVMRDCLSYTDFVLPTQTVEAALNGNPDALYLISANDMHSLKECVDLAAFRIEEIAIQIAEDLTGRGNFQHYAQCGEPFNLLDPTPITMQNLTNELKSTLANFNVSTNHNYESVAIMRANILDALTHTQFQDISRQQIEVVAKGLGLCGRYSGELAQALSIDELGQLFAPNLKDEVIQVLQSSYTMESQRVTHSENTGDAITSQKADQPTVELF